MICVGHGGEQGFERSGWPSWRTEVTVAIAIGAVVAGLLSSIGSVPVGLLAGWDSACLVYLALVWFNVARMDAERTEARATAVDPARPVADLLLLTAAVASLVAVGVVLVRASRDQGGGQLAQVGLGLASVVLSWALVHTIFMLRYAYLYYRDTDGGVDFNDTSAPDYLDFAYLAFTLGMTFQVSDTAIKDRTIRRTALRHALLSYLFGTGILATTVNLVASLSSK
ncbi:MAG TPA: DUF1345 domain-containing protein [Pseudonocardia sp.]|uniref:DUF1345 domain-containing protein n=1 Tax=Pseudonocardia sp. TaxID=60912 RepID=UPI002EDA67EE